MIKKDPSFWLIYLFASCGIFHCSTWTLSSGLSLAASCLGYSTRDLCLWFEDPYCGTRAQELQLSCAKACGETSFPSLLEMISPGEGKQAAAESATNPRCFPSVGSFCAVFGGGQGGGSGRVQDGGRDLVDPRPVQQLVVCEWDLGSLWFWDSSAHKVLGSQAIFTPSFLPTSCKSRGHVGSSRPLHCRPHVHLPHSLREQPAVTAWHWPGAEWGLLSGSPGAACRERPRVGATAGSPWSPPPPSSSGPAQPAARGWPGRPWTRKGDSNVGWQGSGRAHGSMEDSTEVDLDERDHQSLQRN